MIREIKHNREVNHFKQLLNSFQLKKATTHFTFTEQWDEYFDQNNGLVIRILHNEKRIVIFMYSLIEYTTLDYIDVAAIIHERYNNKNYKVMINHGLLSIHPQIRLEEFIYSNYDKRN